MVIVALWMGRDKYQVKSISVNGRPASRRPCVAAAPAAQQPNTALSAEYYQAKDREEASCLSPCLHMAFSGSCESRPGIGIGLEQVLSECWSILSVTGMRNTFESFEENKGLLSKLGRSRQRLERLQV